MPRIVREAEIDWEGTTARGNGVVRALSSGSFELASTIASRVEIHQGKTSPEELLAAAHATCWVTSLGSELARLGIPPERMQVHCTVTMDEVEGAGHRIVACASRPALPFRTPVPRRWPRPPPRPMRAVRSRLSSARVQP